MTEHRAGRRFKPAFTPPNNPGQQTALVEGMPWGPAVTAVMLCLPQAVQCSSVSADKFAVVERKEGFDRATTARRIENTPRAVLRAVTVTAAGKKTTQDSPYLLLELAAGPKTGSPFCYNPLTQKASWCNPYQLSVNLTAPLVTAQGETVSALTLDPDVSFAVPCLDGVDLSGVFTGPQGHTLHYASYTPPNAARGKRPLVIWLHGAGEGGEDPAIVLLGNQVTALFGEAFQSAIGGAYVLAPQTPTFWMQYNAKGDWQDNPGVSSVYRRDLMELIRHYVAQHPQIDPDRIVLGGCSNGGYMTLDLVMHQPGYFAAAYPICEAYLDAGIQDEELRAIAASGLPIWFVYAQNDPVVEPSTHEIPTIRRLASMGADLHTTVWPNVVDKTGRSQQPDGSPYEYNGHFSWVYFFQGLCKDDATGVDLWAWMARQVKEENTTSSSKTIAKNK